MYIGFHVNYPEFGQNRLFQNENAPIGDSLLFPTVMLGKKLEELGWRFNTTDMEPDVTKFDCIFFLDYPAGGLGNPVLAKYYQSGKQNYFLVSCESPLWCPQNYNFAHCGFFKKILTWNDDMVKAFPSCEKLFIANKINLGDQKFYNPDRKNKFVMIACDKANHNIGELYSKRREAIDEVLKLDGEIDLYGHGWNIKKYPFYKGTVSSKKEILSQYKFAICFENFSAPGYITEKIIDCLMAGCLPVYLGAPNIEHHVPEYCFIDARNSRAIALAMCMTDEEYYIRLAKMWAFITSGAENFGTDKFVRTMVDFVEKNVPASSA